MAGIGFELRAMIDERKGFVNKARAYLCAGLISSGPWMMTILTLTLLNMAGPYLGGREGYDLFRALVTYAFAFSLILQGIGQMAVTRRIADLLYSKQYERILPAFLAALVVTGLVHAVLGMAFCIWAGFEPGLSCLFCALFAIIGMTWISLVWLSVARQYDEVLRAYVYGTLVAMVGVLLLLIGKGTTGILAAYTAGQAFTLVMLVQTILRGMEAGGSRDFTVWSSVIEFPRLVLVGLFYNAAIWTDKMIFWFRDGLGPHPFVQYHPLYDTCSFLAYMTVVPALAVNLIRLETSFYERYRAYYGAILGGTPLGVIEDKRTRMFDNLRESVVRLLRVQGAITIAFILFAPFIIDFLELPPAAVKVFRLTCLGAFFHVMLLITVLMQLYFDLRTQAAATSFVFLVLNGGLAWWSVTTGVESYGIGYALASFLSLLLGYQLLHRNLERLDYMTFTNQPIGGDRPDELEAEPEDEDDDDDAPAKPATTAAKSAQAAAAVAQLTDPEPTAADAMVDTPEAEPEPETAPAVAVSGKDDDFDGSEDTDAMRFVMYPQPLAKSAAPSELEPVQEGQPDPVARTITPIETDVAGAEVAPHTATDIAVQPFAAADDDSGPQPTATDVTAQPVPTATDVSLRPPTTAADILARQPETPPPAGPVEIVVRDDGPSTDTNPSFDTPDT
ncbi:MAG: exopolysaccharide Pel transporter PelG, partial [Planctomycetota bacterium]|nr:exopolysaccharide Pel transporter PelG [Planctomycetota bacterium]